MLIEHFLDALNQGILDRYGFVRRCSKKLYSRARIIFSYGFLRTCARADMGHIIMGLIIYAGHWIYLFCPWLPHLYRVLSYGAVVFRFLTRCHILFMFDICLFRCEEGNSHVFFVLHYCTKLWLCWNKLSHYWAKSRLEFWDIIFNSDQICCMLCVWKI